MLLAEQIQAVELRYARTAGTSAARRPNRVMPTGWPGVDAALQGGLICGALHEWIGIAPPTSSVGECCRSWTPPVVPLVHLAWRWLDASCEPMKIVWIGERCFPYPRAFVRGRGDDRRLLESSIFVSPRNDRDRLWAVDASLRSPVVGLVIADGSRFDMAATRRLQLVAKSYGTPALVVRPPWEFLELSAAQTRWLLRWEVLWPSAPAPRWSLELLRCKGGKPNETLPSWVLEWNRAACTLDLSAAMAPHPGSAKAIAGVEGRSANRCRSA